MGGGNSAAPTTGRAPGDVEPKGLGVGDSSKWRRVGVICTWRDMVVVVMVVFMVRF